VALDGQKGRDQHQALEKRRHDFKLAHCWAHARTKFVEIEETFPKPSGEAIGLIAELCPIERDLQEKPPDMRLSIRATRVDPELYLKTATLEAIGGRPIPLPHQLG
jgi:hypothetical protein